MSRVKYARNKERERTRRKESEKGNEEWKREIVGRGGGR
jgi:hypothetical protein